MDKTKVFNISRNEVYDAWLQVKRNKGSHGIDDVSIEMYELNLKNNLYKLWNHMSSGCYFPQGVRVVSIPKSNKGFRKLGIPTINDRIAQTVVANILNQKIDPSFHKDSYGYRPGKRQHHALEVTKQRCFEKPFVIDFDIKGLFDNIPHELIYKALEVYELERWIMLYIKRWLEISDTNKTGLGTPQGGVVSPILANVFMDVCFDKWMLRNYPSISFARYADDCIVHCVSEKQVVMMLSVIEQRLNKCGLKLNRDKTRLANTKGVKSTVVRNVTFDFLGFTYKPTKCRSKKTKESFVGFLPKISTQKKVEINRKIKESKILIHTEDSVEEIAESLNPKIRGWCNYYGYFSPRSLLPVYNLIDNKIAKFMKKKYKLSSHGQAYKLVRKMKKENPKMFYHWSFANY